jgi:F420-0:gamma-glutamyl ligase-like protein
MLTAFSLVWAFALGYFLGGLMELNRARKRNLRRQVRRSNRRLSEYETRCVMGIDEKQYQMRAAGLLKES